MLEDPDRVQLIQRYTAKLGKEYDLELRISGCTGDSEDIEDSRYVYLYKDDEDWNCVFSLDLNSIMNAGEPCGILDDPSSVAEAAVNNGRERELLMNVHALVKEYEDTQQVSGKTLDAVQTLFLGLIVSGSTYVIRDVSRSFADGTTLCIRSTAIEGSLEHIWQSDLENEALVVTLENNSWEHATVLTQSRNGRFETYTRHNDELEAVAAYLDPEDVVRNEDGKIILLHCDQDRTRVIEAAERATGVRGLHADQLRLIDEYLSEITNLG